MSCEASNSSDRLLPEDVKPYDIIYGYVVLSFLGEGVYGRVARCHNLHTAEIVALKIQESNENQDKYITNELRMLNTISVLDPDKKNIVKFIESFMFEDRLCCMAFEILDMSLHTLLSEFDLSLSLNEIRPILHQIMIGLDALKNLGIMHTDLKLDNIMLVNHKDEPFKIKLIDFGIARLTEEMEVGEEMQNPSYRAPEVMLGLPLTEAVDMWSVGCIMLDFIRYNPFPDNCEYRWMKTLLTMFGQPDNHLLATGEYSKYFFILEEKKGWRLMTPKEYQRMRGEKPKLKNFDVITIEELVHEMPDTDDELEYKDRMAFKELLKRCLNIDPERRITASEALIHPFLTMVHMVDELTSSSYADDALDHMIVSPLDNLDEIPDSSLINDNSSEMLNCNSSNPEAFPNRTDYVTHGQKSSSAYGGLERLFQRTKNLFRRVARHVRRHTAPVVHSIRRTTTKPAYRHC